MPSDWVVCAGMAADPSIDRILWGVLAFSLLLLGVFFCLSCRAGPLGVTLWSKTLAPGVLVSLGLSITKCVNPSLLIIGQDVVASILITIGLISYNFSALNLSSSFVMASLEIAQAPAKAKLQASMKPTKFLMVVMGLCQLASCVSLYLMLVPSYREVALRVFFITTVAVACPGIILLAWQGRRLSIIISQSYPNTGPPGHFATFTTRLNWQARVAWVMAFVVLGLHITFAVLLEFSTYFFLPCLWTVLTWMQLALLCCFKFKSLRPPPPSRQQSDPDRVLVHLMSSNPTNTRHLSSPRDYSESKAHVFHERSELGSSQVVTIHPAPRVDVELAESSSMNSLAVEEALMPLRSLTPSREHTALRQPSTSNIRQLQTPSSAAPAFTFEETKEGNKSVSPRKGEET